MRTPDMPWRQFFEELKKVPPEEPFTLGLSDDGDARVKESRPRSRNTEISPIRPVFGIRNDPESLIDLRDQGSTEARFEGHYTQRHRNCNYNTCPGAAYRTREKPSLGELLRETVYVGIAALGLCTFLALIAALYSGRIIVVPERSHRNWISPV
jgi:hypothetical protein